MKKNPFYLIFLFAFVSSLVLSGCGGGHFQFPAVVVPPKPTIADYPDSRAVVLNDARSVDFRISDSGGRKRLIAVETHHRRIKVLSKRGLAEAEVSLEVDGFSTVTNVAGRSVGLDGTVVTMNRRAVRYFSGTKSNPEASNLGLLRFGIPGAEVGGIVEYYYERIYTEPDLIPVWVFGDRMPVLRSEFSLSSDTTVDTEYRFGRGASVVDVTPLRRATKDGRERLVFVETNVPPIYPESGSPHPAWRSPWVAVAVSSAQIKNRKYRMETWAHVGERLGFFVGLIQPNAMPTKGSAEDRYKMIRDHLNPVRRPGLGVLSPISADGIALQKPICSRDAAGFLTKVLRAVGEDAHIALISSNAGPPVLDGFPGLYPFVRAVVAVDVHKRLGSEKSCLGPPAQRSVLCSTGKHGYAFVDPLCKTCQFGELPNELTGGRALVLSAPTPEWVDVPLDPPERNFSVIDSELSANLDGKLRGMIRIATSGEPSRALQTLRAVPRFKRELQQQFAKTVGTNPRMTFRNLEWTIDSKTGTLNGQAAAKSEFKKLAYDRFEVRADDIAGVAFPWKWRKLRRSPRVLEAPFWRQATASVRVPVGLLVDVPPPFEIKNRFGEFSAVWASRGNTVRYWRSFILRQQVILPEDWKDFSSFLDEIRRWEKRPIGILRKPE